MANVTAPVATPGSRGAWDDVAQAPKEPGMAKRAVALAKGTVTLAHGLHFSMTIKISTVTLLIIL